MTERTPMRCRRRAWPVVVASFGIVAILAAGFAPAVVAKPNAWTLTRTPGSVPNGQPTPIGLVATNIGNSGAAGAIGCIVIVVPSALSVGAATVTTAPAGSSWTDETSAGVAGETVVRFRATNDASVLVGDPLDQALRFTVRVTGLAQGTTKWVADVYNQIDCTDDLRLTKNISVTVNASTKPKPTPKPTPMPTATTSPTATPAPRPTATAIPGPTATAIPGPTAAPGTTSPPGATGAPGSTLPPNASPAASVFVPPGSPTATPTTSPRPTNSAGTPPAAGGAGGADPPPGTAFAFPVSGADGTAAHAGMFGDSLSEFTGLFGRTFDWAVPGLVLSIPGLLLVLAILAQTMGALAWLPLVRRRIGGFGFRSGTSAAAPVRRVS
jgi:hypothetical protein